MPMVLSGGGALTVASTTVCLALPLSAAIDNGLGVTPPKGWRSWNFYLSTVNQTVMKAQMDAAVDKSRSVNGVPTSLAELGYDLIAMDDGWQKCNCSTRGDLDGSLPTCNNCMSEKYGPGSGGGCSFHSDGSRGPVGTPVVDTRRFPNMSALVFYGHSLGLRVGGYLNNCAWLRCIDRFCSSVSTGVLISSVCPQAFVQKEGRARPIISKTWIL